MKRWTIANRIQMSFVAAIGMVLLIGFLSFYYINQLNKGLERVVQEDIRLARLTEEIKNTTFEIFQQERRILAESADPQKLADILNLTKNLKSLTQRASDFSLKQENIDRYNEIKTLTEDYETALQKLLLNPDSTQEKNIIREKLIKISSLNRQIQLDRYKELDLHQKQVAHLSSEAQRNMIIVVLLMLLSGLALGFVAPNLVVTPFKKMVQAINEVRTGKLNISIPVDADDEIGTLAKSLNNMIYELKEFDEMKIKRIAFERRRFETLANMVDYGVMVLKREGVIEFINSQLYLLLGLDTGEIEGYRLEHTPLPQSIKDLCFECLNTKEKIDNREMVLHLKDRKGSPLTIELLVDTSMVRTHDGTIVNIVITFEEKKAHLNSSHFARLVSKKDE